MAIGCIAEQHNTALYFKRAARAAGHQVTVINDARSLSHAGPLDLFLVIDPWIEGIFELPFIPCPTAVVLIDVHRDLPTRALFAKFFDHVFIAQLDYVANIADAGHLSVEWLPLAGDPSLHFIPDLQRDIEVGFVGKLGMPGSDRFAILTKVLQHFKTNQVDQHYSPWEMGRIYSRSRIVLNKSIGGDLNMRVFEALAAGAMLVTDRIGNGLEKLMTEGIHYIGYDTADEAIDLIKHFLADEEGRSRIAQSGQELLFSHHSYLARLSRILEVTQTTVPSCYGPARLAMPSQRLRWQAQLARLRGVSLGGAAALMTKGLSPSGYPDLVVGLARSAKRSLWRNSSY